MATSNRGNVSDAVANLAPIIPNAGTIDRNVQTVLQQLPTAFGGNLNQMSQSDVSGLVNLMRRVFYKNEAQGVNQSYRLTLSTENSALSFGPKQWDLGSGPNFPQAAVLKAVLGSVPGWSDRRITNAVSALAISRDALNRDYAAGGQDWSTVREAIVAVNGALAQAATRAADMSSTMNLQYQQALLNNVNTFRADIRQLETTGPRGLQVASYINSHPIMTLLMLDFANQFGTDGTLVGQPTASGTPGIGLASLMTYLRNGTFKLNGVDVTMQGPFNLANYLQFILQTHYAASPRGQCDLIRRFEHVMNIADQAHVAAFDQSELTDLHRFLDHRAATVRGLCDLPDLHHSFLVPSDGLQVAYDVVRDSKAVTASAQFPSGWSFNPTVLATLPDGSTYKLYIAACTGSCHDCPPNSTFQFDYYINMYISHGPAVLAGGIWSQHQGVASFHPYTPYEQPNAISDLPVPQTPSGTPDQLAAGYILEFVRNAYAYGQAHGWNHVTPQEQAQALAQAPSVGGGTTFPWPDGTGQMPTSVADAAADSRWAHVAPLVAQQIVSDLGLSGGNHPTLIFNPETAGLQSNGAPPFVDEWWAGPGDAVFVWDPTTVRRLVADAPGQTVVSFGSDATLDGTPGNDTLWAGDGDNTLIGGPGDVLHGGSENNVFIAGPNNVMYAGPGTNTFKLAPGFGQATIYAGGGGTDTVQFGTGVTAEDVRVVPRGWTDDLVLQVRQNGDTVTLKNWYETFAADGPQGTNDPFQEHAEWGTRIGHVGFADGTVWDAATLRRKSLAANAPGETIVGFDTNDLLIGRPGHDELWAGAGNDTLIGGPEDVLHGGSGPDVFVSGRNNTIFAGTGTNRVKFGRQDGQDILNAGAGGLTTVELGPGIKPLDVVFALHPTAAQAEDLQVSIHNSTDDFGRGDDPNKHGDDDGSQHRAVSGIAVTSWNAAAGVSAAPPVATFETKHAELPGTEVGPLIQAMATFTADTGLSWDQAIEQRRGDVEAILAPYWHTTRQQPAEGWTREDHGDHGHGLSR